MCDVKNIVLEDDIVAADCYPSGDPHITHFFLKFNIHTGEVFEGFNDYNFYQSNIISALRYQYKNEGKLPERRHFLWY